MNFRKNLYEQQFEHSLYKAARILTNKDLVNISGPVHFLIYQTLACNYGNTPGMSQII